MISVRVQNRYLDLYGDETISIKSGLKDYRALGQTRADYSNQFTIPATNNNNDIFKHYFNADYASSDDLRQPLIPVHIEIDSLPFKQGYFKVESGEFEMEYITDYSATFFSNDVNLNVILGEYSLKNLNWDIYNSTKTAAFVKKGVDGGTSLGTADFPEDVGGDVLDDDVIFPLVQRDSDGTKWTDIDMTTSSIPSSEFYPAVRLDAIVRRIEATIPGLTIKQNGDFFDQAHFNDAYMYLPNEIPAGTAGVFGGEAGTEISIDDSTPPNSFYIDYIDNSINTGALDQDYRDTRITAQFYPSSQLDEYSIKEYRDYGSGYTLFATHPFTGNGVEVIELFNNHTVERIKFFGISDTPVDLTQVNLLVEAKPSNPDPYQYVVNTFITSDVYIRAADYYFAQRLPPMLIRDFLSSLTSTFNMVVYYNSDLNYSFESYDDWLV